MSESKNKIISHRRAEWFVGGSITLSDWIKTALGKSKTIQERTVHLDDGRELKCLSANTSAPDGGVFLHITTETPGEPASIVPKSDLNAVDGTVNTISPPQNAEFMDGDAFLYVVGNDVCLCGTNFLEGTMKLYLYEFFKKSKLKGDSDKFDLLKTTDMEKLKLLSSEKIDEIQLKATAYKASANFARRKGRAANISGVIAKAITALSGAENDVTNDSIRIMLTIKTDKRSPKHLTLGENRIEGIARDLIENEEEGDEYVIKLASGNTISPKEMFVRTSVAIEGHGKSVNKEKTWNHLRTFYVSLKEASILDT